VREGAYIDYLTVIRHSHIHTQTSEVRNFTVQENGDPTHT